MIECRCDNCDKDCSNDYVYCAKCRSKMEDEINNLQNTISNYESEINDLQNKIRDLEAQNG